MSVKIAVVNFESPTSTGTQDITSTGFGTPKAALFFWNRRTTTFSTSTSSNHMLMGMGATDGTNEWATSSMAEHNAGTSDTSRRGDTASCVQICNPWDGGVNGEASFDSWITDGIRIDWTNSASTDFKVTCVLFGGDDLSANAGTDNCNESVGSSKEIDTGTVEPNLVILASHREAFDDAKKDHSSFTIGFASDKGGRNSQEQASLNISEGDGLGTTQNQGQLYHYSDTRRILKNNTSADGDAAGMEVTEFRPSGNATSFEVTQRDATGRMDFAFLALSIARGDVDWFITDSQTPTSTGTRMVQSGDGQPLLVLGIQSRMTTIDGTIDNAGGGGSIGLSAADGTNQYVANSISEDNVGTSVTKSRHAEALFLGYSHDNGTSDDYVATLESLTGSGWEEDWTQVDTGTAYYTPLLVITEAISFGPQVAKLRRLAQLKRM